MTYIPGDAAGQGLPNYSTAMFADDDLIDNLALRQFKEN